MSTEFYIVVPVAHRFGAGDHKVSFDWKMKLDKLLPLLEREGSFFMDEYGTRYSRSEFVDEMNRMLVSEG